MKNQRGNALIYVLIAVALFGALSFVLARQTNTGEAGTLSDEKAELYAMQMLDYTAQVKSVVDQMLFSGISDEDLDFTLPGETDPGSKDIYKVFHPDGGGLVPAKVNESAMGETVTVPVSNWYLGEVGNIDWSKGAGTEILLTAHNISRQICEKINRKLLGSGDIPALAAGSLNDYIIPDRFTGGGGNSDLTAVECADCEKHLSICMSDTAAGVFSFYSVIVNR